MWQKGARRIITLITSKPSMTYANSDMLLNTKGITQTFAKSSYNSIAENIRLPMFVDDKPEHISTTQIERYHRETKHPFLAPHGLSTSVKEYSGCLPQNGISLQFGENQQADENGLLNCAFTDCPQVHNHLTQKPIPLPRKQRSGLLPSSRDIIQKSPMAALSHNNGDAVDKRYRHRGNECDPIPRVNIKVTFLDDDLGDIVTVKNETHSQWHSTLSHHAEKGNDKSPKKLNFYRHFDLNLFQNLFLGPCADRISHVNDQSLNIVNSSKDTYWEDTPVDGDIGNNTNWNKSQAVFPARQGSSEDITTGVSFPYSNAVIGVSDQQVNGKHYSGKESEHVGERYISAMLKSGDSLQVGQLYKPELMPIRQVWYKHAETSTHMSRLFPPIDTRSPRRKIKLSKINQGKFSQLPIGHVTTQGQASREVGLRQVAVGSNYHTHELANSYAIRSLYALNQRSEIPREMVLAVEHNLLSAILVHPFVSPVEYPTVESLLEIGQSSTDVAVKVPTYRAKHCGVQTVLTATSSSWKNVYRKGTTMFNHLAWLCPPATRTLTTAEPANNKRVCLPYRKFGIKNCQPESDTTKQQHTLPALPAPLSWTDCNNLLKQLQVNGKPSIFKSIQSPSEVKMIRKDATRTETSPINPEVAACNGPKEQDTILSAEHCTDRGQRFLQSTGYKESDEIESGTVFPFFSQDATSGSKESTYLKTTFQTGSPSFDSERPTRHRNRDLIISSPIRFPSLDVTRENKTGCNLNPEKKVLAKLGCGEYGVQPAYNINSPTFVDVGFNTEQDHIMLSKSHRPSSTIDTEYTKFMLKRSSHDNNMSTELAECREIPTGAGFSSQSRTGSISPVCHNVRIPPDQPTQSLETRTSIDLSEAVARRQPVKSEAEAFNKTQLKDKRKEQELNWNFNEGSAVTPQSVSDGNSLLGDNMKNAVANEFRKVHFQNEKLAPGRFLPLGSSLFLEDLQNTRRSIETTPRVTQALTKYYSMNTSEHQKIAGCFKADMEHQQPLVGSVKDKRTDTGSNTDEDTFDYSSDVSLYQDNRASDSTSEVISLSSTTSPNVLKAVDECVFNGVQSTLHKTLFISLTVETQHNIVTGIPNKIRNMHTVTSPTFSTTSSSENVTQSFLASNIPTTHNVRWSGKSSTTSHRESSSSGPGKQQSLERGTLDTTHVGLVYPSLKGYGELLEDEKGYELVLKDLKTRRQPAVPYQPHKSPSRLRSLWCCTPRKYNQYKLSPQ